MGCLCGPWAKARVPEWHFSGNSRSTVERRGLRNSRLGSKGTCEEAAPVVAVRGHRTARWGRVDGEELGGEKRWGLTVTYEGPGDPEMDWITLQRRSLLLTGNWGLWEEEMGLVEKIVSWIWVACGKGSWSIVGDRGSWAQETWIGRVWARGADVADVSPRGVAAGALAVVTVNQRKLWEWEATGQWRLEPWETLEASLVAAVEETKRRLLERQEVIQLIGRLFGCGHSAFVMVFEIIQNVKIAIAENWR